MDAVTITPSIQVSNRLPFVLFGGLILYMYRTLAHVPGGQPIGGLERVAANVAALFRRATIVRRLMPAGRRG